MSEREEHLRKVSKDREEGYEGLLDVQAKKSRPKPTAMLIIEALDKRYEKSTNPLGLSGNLTSKDLVALLKSGQLDEAKAEHVDRWLTEEEIFDAAMSDHVEDYGHYGAMSFFNEAMRGLKAAQLIAKGPSKKTWLLSMGPVQTFLGSIKPGERFTGKSLAEYAGKSHSWASHKLAATGKLGITKKVGVDLHERI